MNFRLEISLENDAFREDPGAEVARILSRHASRIRGAGFSDRQPLEFWATGSDSEVTLSDVNGQSVGRAWVEEGPGDV